MAIGREPADAVSARVGKVLSGAGLVAWAQGDPATARERLVRAVAVWRALGDPGQLAQALRFLSAVHEYTGNLTTARALVEKSLALFRTVADPFGLAMTLGRLGTPRSASATSRRPSARSARVYGSRGRPGTRGCSR